MRSLDVAGLRSLPSRARPQTLAAFVVPVAVLLATVPFSFHVAGSQQDEGAFLLYGDRVLHGAVGYRDFLTFYGPGNPWLMAAAFRVAGSSIWAERGVGLLYQLAVPLLIAGIGLRWSPRVAATAGALSTAAVLSLGPSPIPFLAAIALILASILLMAGRGPERPGRSRYVCAGAVAALSITFRIDIAPAVVISAVPLLLGAGRRAAWFALGAGVGLLPLIVDTEIASPGLVFQNVWIDAVLRQAAGRRLPIPPPMKSAEFALAGTLLAVAADIVAAGASLPRIRRDDHSRLLVALTALAVGLLPEMLQRDDLPHILMAASVAGGILPMALASLSARRRMRLPRPHTTTYAAAALIALAGVGFAALTLWPNRGDSVANRGREFLTSRTDAAQAQSALDAVDRLARPGQRIFVGTSDMRRTNYTDTYLYYLLPQLVPATYYLEFEPLVVNRADSGLANQIASADVLILTTEWENWPEHNASQLYGSSEPNRTVRRLFCLRVTVGHYRLYARC